MKESQHDVAVPTVSGAFGPLAVLFAISGFPGLASSEGVPRSLNEVLEPIRARHELPALAAAIVTTEGLQAIGATGVRRAGHGEAVTPDDLWHLGSCTKAMTATLVARLVEQGKMQWTTSMGATFPELAKTIDPLWRSVTVEQLLTNRGGAPEKLDRDGLWNRLWEHRGTTMEARGLLLAGVVKYPPEYAPGSKYLYSNANFAIAGHLAETVVGAPWEELIRREVFEPLGITTAGFGAPGHAGNHADEPWGHELGNKPKEPGLSADNPVAIGPAGIVHMSLLDWGRFVRAHLLAARGDVVTATDGKSFLSRESWRKLHTAPAGEPKYAMGWVLLTRPWAKGDRRGDSGYVLTHDGSNTLWFCVTWLAPEKGFAVLVTSNAGGNGAHTATDDAAWAVVQDWLGR